MPEPDEPFELHYEKFNTEKMLADIWGPALQEQLKSMPLFARIPVDYKRRHRRFKRVRFVLRRINEAWGVLFHGLPEQW